MKSKANSRNIVVNTVHYRWRATGNDGYISFTIWPDSDSGPTITGNLSYGETVGPPQENGNGLIYHSLGNQIVITNRIIRKIILVCISKHSYNPSAKGKELTLRKADALIDMSDAIRAVRRDG